MENEFKINRKQIVLLALLAFAGLFVFASAYAFKKQAGKAVWDGAGYSIQNVNKVDAALAQPYNHLFDQAGTAVCLLAVLTAAFFCLLVPAIRALKEKKGFLQVFVDGVIFVQDCLFSIGIYTALKTFVGRIRPYMYFPNPDLSAIAEGDFNRSWPSGHTSLAFIAAGYLICWLFFRDASSSQKKWLSIFILATGVLTAVLRILSGNHFLTDVLCGALIGFSSSAAVFTFDEIVLSKNQK